MKKVFSSLRAGKGEGVENEIWLKSEIMLKLVIFRLIENCELI